MFGNTELTAVLGGAPRPTADPSVWVGYARALAGIGLPVMLIAPGTKRPADLRTDKERNDDAEAADGLKHGGVHLATDDPKLLKKYVERAMRSPEDKRPKGHPAPLAGPLNWAVRLGGSGYVVADADTPGEVAALRAFLERWYGPGRTPGPTVVTPGTADGAHHGGGHWWFKLPDGLEVDPEVMPAVLKVSVDGHAEGFSLYTGNAYVLIPPSVRDTGAYRLVTPDNDAPPPLLDYLNHALTEGRTRVAKREEYTAKVKAGELGTLDAQVCEWSAATPWSSVLDPHGWTDTGTVDSCGCPVYTAPGAHSSPKSATAHEGTCTEGRYDVLNPPLHLWTDNPGPELAAEVAARGGAKTLSKLTVWAALEHGGSMGAALAAAGIETDPTGKVFGPADIEDAGVLADTNTGATPGAVDASAGLAPSGSAMDAPTPPAASSAELGTTANNGAGWAPPRPAIDLEQVVTTPTGQEMWAAWGVAKPAPEHAEQARLNLPPWAALSTYRDMPAPEYVLDGLLEHRALSSVIGDSGVGKSAVVLDMAAHIATGKPWHGRRTIKCPVVYVAGEGVSGAIKRLHAWQRAHEDYTIGDQIYIVEEAMLLGSRTENWAYVAEQVRAVGAGLVIFDTLARMATGLDENSATDMGKGVTVFDRLRRTTGAGVLLVHHTARGAAHGRGSSAIRGAVDSEVLVTDTMVDGKLFAADADDRPVDSDGNPLPGKPVCVKSVKQKNAADDEHTYVCLTSRHESVVVTDLDGNAATPEFARGGGTTLGEARGESMLETAERIADYVARYTSGEKYPTMGDIGRAVAPDRAHVGKSKEWRARLDLATDKALERRLIYRVGNGYTATVPLD